MIKLLKGSIVILLLFFFRAEAQPLFNSDALLELELDADFTSILKDRSDERKRHKALILIAERSIEVPVKVKVRGNYRRDSSNCAFPPLEIKISKDQADMTSIRKIKLVTHCNNDPDFQKFLLKEYLVYRIYEILTEVSFRTRLCSITYMDKGEKLFSRYAFFIEEEKKMVKRIGAERIKHLSIPGDIPNFKGIDILSVFQYMIGNTDWYIPDHNIKIVKHNSDTIAVPYDFDLSGFVDLPDATPRAGTAKGSVTNRYYLGHCRTEDEIDKLTGIFIRHQTEIKTLINEFPHLSEAEKEKTLRFVKGFFDLIKDPELFQKQISGTCGNYF